jgi:large subunit ribosomal protein L23
MKHGARSNPYSIVLNRHVTEKAMALQQLESSESNQCTKRCKSPKLVFRVHPASNKRDIAWAVEEIYRDRKIKVVGVNTINIKPKRRRVRGKLGFRSGYKKAVVTLEAGDSIEEI